MALYNFQIPAMVYISLAVIAAIPILVGVFSFDWASRLRPQTGERDRRRLTQATLELNRILGDRDRLNVQYASSLQQLEARLQEARVAAASELSALQAQLKKRDVLLKRLKIRLKEKSRAAAASAHRKGRTARGGSIKSRAALAKPAQRVPVRAKVSVREANLH